MIIVTAKRGLHVRPSRILEEQIKKIKEKIYFLHKGRKKHISSMTEILQMEIQEGDQLEIDVFPFSKKIQEKLYNTIRNINQLRFE